MAYENNGVLFRNKDKDNTEKTAKWADYNGKANVGGVNYYLSGWLKMDKNGDKYLSIAFKLAEQKSDFGKGKPQPRQRPDEDLDRPF